MWVAKNSIFTNAKSFLLKQNSCKKLLRPSLDTLEQKRENK